MKRLTRFTLSPMGYLALRYLQDGIPLDILGSYDQRPIASMIRRGYARRDGASLAVTREGKEALRQFENADIMREKPSDKLGVYVQQYLDMKARRKSA